MDDATLRERAREIAERWPADPDRKAMVRMVRDEIIQLATDHAAAEKQRAAALAGAIETLVCDEIISAGRARELTGMTPEQQRAHWRKMLGPRDNPGATHWESCAEAPGHHECTIARYKLAEQRADDAERQVKAMRDTISAEHADALARVAELERERDEAREEARRATDDGTLAAQWCEERARADALEALVRDASIALQEGVGFAPPTHAQWYGELAAKCRRALLAKADGGRDDA